MIPTMIMDTTEKQDFTITDNAVDMPTLTYKMDLEQHRVRNYADGVPAMRQAIFKILQTERYQHKEIYSDNYGVEFKDLFGMPTSYCVPEIERRIKEALLWDERITNVYNFVFSLKKRGVVGVTFNADTIFGSTTIETEVAIA